VPFGLSGAKGLIQSGAMNRSCKLLRQIAWRWARIGRAQNSLMEKVGGKHVNIKAFVTGLAAPV
jgi:hypothetical protein